jgi:hypothetical protein
MGAVADIPGIAAMVEDYWRIEAIGGFDQRAVETTLSALLSHPSTALAGWLIMRARCADI